MTKAKEKAGQVAPKSAPKKAPTPKPVPADPIAPEAVEEIKVNSREALLDSVAEAHALITRRKSSEILPSPVFLFDIEGLDVLASTAISSLGIIYMDASRATAGDLIEAVARSAYAAHKERQHGPDSDDVAMDSERDPCVAVKSWNFDVDAQVRRYGRTVSRSTQTWWANASPQAHAAAAAPRYSLTPCLGDTLLSIRQFVISCLNEVVLGLSLEDSETIMQNIRFVVRGSQYDAAALETLFQQVLDIRPAPTPETAFANIPDPDTGNQISTLWFFRSVIEIRSYLDGYRSGLLAASGNRAATQEHLDAAYKYAANNRRMAANSLADMTFGNQAKSQVYNSLHDKQAALALRASGGRHVGEFDSLYDALLILPTLNGKAARQFAESLLGDEDVAE